MILTFFIIHNKITVLNIKTNLLSPKALICIIDSIIIVLIIHTPIHYCIYFISYITETNYNNYLKLLDTISV